MIINIVRTCYLSANFVKLYKHKSIIHSYKLKHRLSACRFKVFELCYKEEIIQRELFYLETLKPNNKKYLFSGSSLGFKYYYFTVVQMKVIKKNYQNISGRKHSREYRFHMSL